MKKGFVIVIVLLLAGCSSINTKESDLEENTNDTAVKYDFDPFELSSDSYYDFNTFVSEINNKRVVPNLDNLDVTEFTHDFYNDLNLVSQDEADRMRDPKPNPDYSLEGVLEDIDLYFRCLKAYYASYEYFGGDDSFNVAQKNIVDELSSYKGRLNKEIVQEIVVSNLEFVVDGHARFGDLEFVNYNHQQVYDHYLAGYYFYHDEKGYFTNYDGGKLYIKSVCGDDANNYLKMSIDDEGRLAYAIILSCTDNDSRLNSPYIELYDANNDLKIDFSWSEFNKRNYSESMYFQSYENANGVSVVSVRDLGESASRADEIPAHLKEIGFNSKNDETIIYDVLTFYDWDRLIADKGYRHYSDYSNFKASYLAKYIGRTSIMPKDITYGQYYHRIIKGIWCEDDSIKFFIQDHNNGSGLESMLLGFKTLSNTIFVGGRSKGLMTTGGNSDFFLINTGIGFQLGMNLQFVFDNLDNYDGVGCEPDVWVNPCEAKEKILKLTRFYGINNVNDFESIIYNNGDNDSNNYSSNDDVFLNTNNGYKTKEGSGFGLGKVNKHKVYLEINGEKIKGVSVSVSDPDVAEVDVTEDGDILLTSLKEGEIELYIEYQNNIYSFGWLIQY